MHTGTVPSPHSHWHCAESPFVHTVSRRPHKTLGAGPALFLVSDQETEALRHKGPGAPSPAVEPWS